jgi:hypothetical protein
MDCDRVHGIGGDRDDRDESCDVRISLQADAPRPDLFCQVIY